MEKQIVPIKGMHCRSCEILIEESLREIKGLKGVKVSYKAQNAEFFLNSPATMKQVETAVTDAGYEVGKDEKGWMSENPADYRSLAIAAVILFLLYLIGKKLGLASISTGSKGSPSGLLVVLVVGLTAGVSTCMALVGGLILGISARHAEKHLEATPAQKFRPHLFFNLGRIASYALLGGLIGLVGKAFQFSGLTLGLLTLIVGIVMLTLGIQLTEIFPRISSAHFTLPASLSKLLGIKKNDDKEYSHFDSIITGALTFFLPCGFTQAMQLYAMTTGNFFHGAAIMGVFALGTAPGLLSVGGLTSFIKGSFAKNFFKFAGLLVISLALLNISNGFNLLGWKGISISHKNSIATAAPIEDGYQVVNMTQSAGGYSPNKFTIQKGIPVKWIINSTDASSCSSSIVSGQLNIRKFLNPGKNVIEFTPTNLGDMTFSCSMGMYSGKFTVIENNQSTNLSQPLKSSLANNSIQSNNSSVVSLSPDTQIIKANFGAKNINATSDITPSQFTISVNEPVHFEVYAEIDGQGCMSSIKVQGLSDTPQFLQKGKTAVFDFTPQQKGTYLITCAMGAPRGKIIVN